MIIKQFKYPSHVFIFLNRSTSEFKGGGPPPPTSRFGGPTVQFGGPSVLFKSKIMNFRVFISYFFKKISSLASLGMNIILLSHSSSLTLLTILSYLHTSAYIDSSHNLSYL